MAELATLARPYANAVFATARDEGNLERWSRMLGFLAAAAREPAVRRLVDSPEVSDEQKAFRLAEICGDELNDKARKLVHVLARNKRLGLIDEILEQYELKRALDEQTLEVEVVTAYPLSDEEVARLKQALGEKYAKEVNLSSVVDEGLLGGAIIRAGDTVIDGSVRGRLNKLAESLQRT
jgi:F-type H+-transporting ATPase subunit delta